MNKKNRESGAVSLFIVIFTALLITVITVSFVRLMIRDQQQASDNDLSQSALDSAQAGVEDAKRALLRYQKACNDGSPECATLKATFDSPECDVLARAGVAGTVGASETMIQQSASSADSALDQAYTCIKINIETDDYLGQLGAEESRLIPIKGVGSFDKVVLSWFSSRDISDSDSGSIDLQANIESPLSPVSEWPSNRPSVMNAQLIQAGTTFKVSDFDDNSGGKSNTNSLVLYPASAGANSVNFLNARRIATSGPNHIKCENDISNGGYACSVELVIPEPINGDSSNRLVSFLRLTSHYRSTHYSLMLKNGINPVKFDGVQPSVDSTGRANDLFRRIESRIELGDTTFPYPESAVDINGNICKTFYVTDNPVEYNAGLCTP